jgi:hypothetical protein
MVRVLFVMGTDPLRALLETEIVGVTHFLLEERGQNSVCTTPRLDLGLSHGALGSGLRDFVLGWKQLEVAVGWQHVLWGVVAGHCDHLVG